VDRLEALSGEPPVDPIRFFGKIISDAGSAGRVKG
jgi:hypothetical protein